LDTAMSPAGFHERRIHARRQTNSLAYVDLGEDNGGLVLNMSEGGMAVHAAVMLADDHLPKIRFQLPQSQDWIESAAQVTWTGDSRKNAGIEFVGLAEDARLQIRNWLSSSEPAYQPPAVRRRAIDARKLAALAALPVEENSAPSAEAGGSSGAAVATAVPAEPKKNGSGDSAAAVASIARNAPGEIEAPVAPLTSSRQRRWAIHPTFTRSETASPAEAPRFAPEQARSNWPALAGIGILLAVASFVFGMATGRGAWTGIFASGRDIVSSKSAPAAVEAPRAAAPAAADESSSPTNSASAKNASNGAAVPPARGGRGLSAGAPTGQSQGTDANAQSLIVRRAAPPQGARGVNAAPDENSSSVLSMPDTPVSASNSVAVSSRLYIPVPALPGSPGSPQHTGNVQIGRLEDRAEIVYPADAIAQRIEGIVKLHITIGANGAIKNAAPMSGTPLLASAALEAVRQWRYKPTTVDGTPIETEADITAVFRLPQTPQ
jgi:TonB family protein